MSIPSDALPKLVSDVAYHYYCTKGSIEVFDIAINNNAVRSRAIHLKKVFCFISNFFENELQDIVKGAFFNLYNMALVFKGGCNTKTFKILGYQISKLLLLDPLRLTCAVLTMALRVTCSVVGILFPSLMLPGLKYIEYIDLGNLWFKLQLKNALIDVEHKNEGVVMHPHIPAIYYEKRHAYAIRDFDQIFKLYEELDKYLSQLVNLFKENSTMFDQLEQWINNYLKDANSKQKDAECEKLVCFINSPKFKNILACLRNEYQATLFEVICDLKINDIKTSLSVRQIECSEGDWNPQKRFSSDDSICNLFELMGSIKFQGEKDGVALDQSFLNIYININQMLSRVNAFYNPLKRIKILTQI
jgi:hypothetical protein